MPVTLVQSPFSANSYNSLPHINECHEQAKNYGTALRELLSIIYRYKLDHDVSVHLIHKHFDLKDNRVMVYETVNGCDHSDFLLSSPRDPAQCSNLRGLYFKAEAGRLVAYEFTTDEGADVRSKTEFLTEFHDTLVRFEVQEIFALTVKIPSITKLTEIELPLQSSTILLNNPEWLKASRDDTITITDWASSADVLHDANIPGIIQLACMTTRSGAHHGLNCRATRSGHTKRPVGFEGLPGRNTEEDAILKHALTLIDPVA